VIFRPISSAPLAISMRVTSSLASGEIAPAKFALKIAPAVCAPLTMESFLKPKVHLSGAPAAGVMVSAMAVMPLLR